jgi:hypothetical protein
MSTYDEDTKFKGETTDYMVIPRDAWDRVISVIDEFTERIPAIEENKDLLKLSKAVILALIENAPHAWLQDEHDIAPARREATAPRLQPEPFPVGVPGDG